MTHDPPALLARLDSLEGADMASVLAELIGASLAGLIETKDAETLGASRYELSENRTTHRNGHRSNATSIAPRDAEVKILKLQPEALFRPLRERRSPINKALHVNKALHAMIMETYVHGAFIRNVDDHAAALAVTSGGVEDLGRIGRRGFARFGNEPSVHHLP